MNVNGDFYGHFLLLKTNLMSFAFFSETTKECKRGNERNKIYKFVTKEKPNKMRKFIREIYK